MNVDVRVFMTWRKLIPSNKINDLTYLVNTIISIITEYLIGFLVSILDGILKLLNLSFKSQKELTIELTRDKL